MSMVRFFQTLLFTINVAAALFAQTQYTITTVAGGAPMPTPIAALGASIQPNSIALDAAGNLYFSAALSVFRLGADGVIVRVAGDGRRAFGGDGGPAVDAQLGAEAIAVTPDGVLYIVDRENNRIRKITADGIITTIAGTSKYIGYEGDGGPAAAARFSLLTALTLDQAGNLYVADSGNHRVRKISNEGNIETIVGNGLEGNSGDAGPAKEASIGLNMASIRGMCLDASGALYIAVDHQIRKISADGFITTVAGTGVAGLSGDGGLAIDALLTAPAALAIDTGGNLYVSGGGYYPHVRRISADGVITTVAGGGIVGFSGDGEPAIGARLGGVLSLAFDSSGNLLLADTGNNRIRRVSGDGIINTIAGIGHSRHEGEGGLAKAAQLDMPFFVAVDGDENLIIADFGAQKVRRVSGDGIITTIAGNGGPVTGPAVGDGQPATTAHLGRVAGVATDALGNTFIADSDNAVVWRVDQAGTIARVAGSRVPKANMGDGGSALDANFVTPWGLAVDHSGNLYIADENAHRIRKVDSDGVISTVAGTGVQGFAGDGGPATSASLGWPQTVAVDSLGNLYIADYSNFRVRKVSSDGVITTVAGGGFPGGAGDSQGAETSAYIGPILAVAVDSLDNLYISGGSNVFRMSPDGAIAVIAGSSARINTYSGDEGLATDAGLVPRGMAVLPDGRIFVADAYNNAVRLLAPRPVAPPQNLPAARR